jgi:hypothetical protein
MPGDDQRLQRLRPGPPHQLLAVVAIPALRTARNLLVYAPRYGHGQALARDAGIATTLLSAPALLVTATTLG